MAKGKELEISIGDVEFIMGKRFNEFRKITNNVHCHQCNKGYKSKIVNYSISLNYLNDLILRGFCKKCSTKVGYYTETGDDRTMSERASFIKILNKELKKRKVQRVA
jgi:hypothetical protein